MFDNIPLTALALKQGGYDWGFLAYAVGFGGSMIWFGSSAGVALANMYPEAKSAGRWLVGGWHVTVAYVVGFFVMLAVLGWHPDPPHKKRVELPAPPAVVAVKVVPSSRLASLANEPLVHTAVSRFEASRGGTDKASRANSDQMG